MPKTLWQLCAVHNQNPPHYNSFSVSKKYVFQKTTCHLCHTHKCPMNTVGAAWGESPWHILQWGSHVQHVQRVWAWGGVGFLALRNSLGCCSWFFFSGFNPSWKEVEKLTSDFVKMPQVNVPTPLPIYTFKGAQQIRKEKKAIKKAVVCKRQAGWMDVVRYW